PKVRLAVGTPVRLHLRATDATAKGPFRGTYAAVGMPKGATLDPRTGDFAWTAAASAAPVEIGFAAIVARDGGLGDCAPGSLAIEIVDDDAARANLSRWNHYITLRDADLASIPSDGEIEMTWHDGESPEMRAARVVADEKTAHEERQLYLDG